MVTVGWRFPSKTAMAQSKRFSRASHLACVAALGLAFTTQAWTSTPYGPPLIGAHDAARVSLMVDPGGCKPGLVEGLLDDWLVWTKNSEFDSDYAAMAFDQLVDFVYLLRDIAQDFCV
jgi:hypothetical protein